VLNGKWRSSLIAASHAASSEHRYASGITLWGHILIPLLQAMEVSFPTAPGTFSGNQYGRRIPLTGAEPWGEVGVIPWCPLMMLSARIIFHRCYEHMRYKMR
jgi:hypothetical protein